MQVTTTECNAPPSSSQTVAITEVRQLDYRSVLARNLHGASHFVRGNHVCAMVQDQKSSPGSFSLRQFDRLHAVVARTPSCRPDSSVFSSLPPRRGGTIRGGYPGGAEHHSPQSRIPRGKGPTLATETGASPGHTSPRTELVPSSVESSPLDSAATHRSSHLRLGGPFLISETLK